MSREPTTTEIAVTILQETDRAYLVWDGATKLFMGSAVKVRHWLPKSKVDIIVRTGDSATIELPEWLAKEKGLI